MTPMERYKASCERADSIRLALEQLTDELYQVCQEQKTLQKYLALRFDVADQVTDV